MLLIEDHWELIDSLNDISRVVREYYNSELADELDKFIEYNEVNEDRIQKLEELEETIEAIRDLVCE